MSSHSFDSLLDMDFYAEEYSQFQWDVHILIGGTLQASIRYLDTEAKAELAKLEVVMEKQLDVEYHEHLVGEHIDVLATNDNQERFVRNMALVALVSRLTHALRSMARSAELFSPRKKRYGNKSMSEFGRLWLEYTERFGIDFNANVDRVAFVETIREVRNQIVHEGSEANTYKALDELDLHGGDAGYLDMWFSEKYPCYVSGTGIGAEVCVGQEQLDTAVKASLDLVGWLAKELRLRELSSIGKTKNIQ